MDISVVSSRKRLDALELKAQALPVSQDAELQSQLARFMCVLASGLIEQAVVSLLEDYARTRCHPRVQRYTQHQLSKLQNAKYEDILSLVGRFDPTWRKHFSDNVSDEVQSAIDSIVNNRNQIAHGKQVNISLGTFSQYYILAKRFLVDMELFLLSQ
jgi:hypothetical protein